MKNVSKRLLGLSMLIGGILFVPLIAMQFTKEVDWGWSDFMLAFLLLFAAGLLIELFLQRVINKKYRWLLMVILLLCLFMFWAELGVGLFGSTLAGD